MDTNKIEILFNEVEQNIPLQKSYKHGLSEILRESRQGIHASWVGGFFALCAESGAFNHDVRHVISRHDLCSHPELWDASSFMAASILSFDTELRSDIDDELGIDSASLVKGAFFRQIIRHQINQGAMSLPKIKEHRSSLKDHVLLHIEAVIKHPDLGVYSAHPSVTPTMQAHRHNAASQNKLTHAFI